MSQWFRFFYSFNCWMYDTTGCDVLTNCDYLYNPSRDKYLYADLCGFRKSFQRHTVQLFSFLYFVFYVISGFNDAIYSNFDLRQPWAVVIIVKFPFDVNPSGQYWWSEIDERTFEGPKECAFHSWEMKKSRRIHSTIPWQYFSSKDGDNTSNLLLFTDM